MALSQNIYKALNEKNAVQRFVSRKMFSLLQNAGFHVLGDHFYEPIPNTEIIRQGYKDEVRSCLGINFNFEAGEQKLARMIEKWGGEFYETVQKNGYSEKNYFFRGLDSLTLYCLIREVKPKRVIEIGQGISTGIIISAFEANYKETGSANQKFISIDPYDRLSSADKKIEGFELEVLQDSIQNIPTALFSELGKSDLLFVDSSHVYKFGSDVEYIFEEIYPRVAAGVYIHIHDIFSPYHYPLEWYAEQKRFWNEQYYLENFLRYNSLFNIEIPLYYLGRKSTIIKEKCESICKYEDFVGIGYSFYLQKIA